ncbi:MAG TPA: Ig domain-containing protein [Planctomycetota bacterium]
MSGAPPLLSLLGALAALASPGQEPGARLYPGFAAFEPPHVPALERRLAKPLLEAGPEGRRFEPGYFVWLPSGAELVPPGERGLAVPGGAFVLWLAGGHDWLALARSEHTAWLGRYQPGWKLDPALVWDAEDETPLRLALELVPGHPLAALTAELEVLGARIVAGDGAALVVELPPRRVLELARLEGPYRIVQSEEELAPQAVDADSTSRHARDDAQGGSSERLAVPITVTLTVNEGRHSKDGTLAAADLARLGASDDDRLVLRDRETLTLGFTDGVPTDAIVSAVRVLVEHHEEPQLADGDVLWKLAHGSLTAPTIVRTFGAPVRSGANLEALDLWPPGSLVPDFRALVVVIENGSPNHDTLLDRLVVEVDYTLPARAPEITSVAGTSAFLGSPYLYDADGRAEASGDAPLVWSLAGAPAGFTIQPGTGLVSWTPAALGSFPVTLRVTNAHGTATQSFSVAVSEAPFPPTLLPVNATSIGYCPPERLALGPAKTQQRLNVFLPRGTPPPAGWPVVLNNRAGGGIATLPLGSVSETGGTAALHALLKAGVAVVDFGVTGIGDGAGLFYPPGHPSGRYESFAPNDDTPEKDAEWALQWLKIQTAYPLDVENVCLRGSSHGAIISMWAAMGPERARTSGSAQVRASTRVRGVLALQPPVSVWAFLQSADLAVRMVAHFEQAALPGVAATAFGQVSEALQKDGSVMRFAFQTSEARVHNAHQAICLLYSEPVKRVNGAPADMTLDATGYPRLHGVLQQPYIHDAWSGYVLWQRLIGLSTSAAGFHRTRSIFGVKAGIALPPPFDSHTHTFTGSVTGPGARTLAHEWVLRTLGVTPLEPTPDSGWPRVR